MLRKIALPVCFFVFGIFVYFIEDLFMESVLSSGISVIDINNFTPVLFVVVLVLLIVFEVRHNFNDIKDMLYKYLYLLITVSLLVMIAYYWIWFIEWK